MSPFGDTSLGAAQASGCQQPGSAAALDWGKPGVLWQAAAAWRWCARAHTWGTQRPALASERCRLATRAFRPSSCSTSWPWQRLRCSDLPVEPPAKLLSSCSSCMAPPAPALTVCRGVRSLILRGSNSASGCCRAAALEEGSCGLSGGPQRGGASRSTCLLGALGPARAEPTPGLCEPALGCLSQPSARSLSADGCPDGLPGLLFAWLGLVEQRSLVCSLLRLLRAQEACEPTQDLRRLLPVWTPGSKSRRRDLRGGCGKASKPPKTRSRSLEQGSGRARPVGPQGGAPYINLQPARAMAAVLAATAASRLQASFAIAALSLLI